MRIALLIPALLLAACDAAPEWRNQQAQLANDLNPPEPAADETLMAETDYTNEAAPAANDANAAEAVIENEVTEAPAAQE